VIGKVVGNEIGSDTDNDTHYSAIIEYTHDGQHYVTHDGPTQYRPYELGRPVRIYHIPGSGKPGRYVSVVALALFLPLFLVVNLLAVGMAISITKNLWPSLLGKGAP
jgi:hypothetical protein